MKKTFLKQLLIVFSGAFFLIYGTIYACGGGYEDWDFTFTTNFTPETFVDKSYAPLFLSEDLFYSKDEIEHGAKFNDEIVDDWSKYLGKSIDKQNIKFFLLEKSKVDIDNLFNFFGSKKANSISIKWSKKINLTDAKTKNFIEFLYYSKAIEAFSTQNDYDWSYENAKNNSFSDLKWLKAIENKYNTTNDVFLKNRYWFQTIKSNFYSNQRAHAVEFYAKTAAKTPRNTLYYRGMAYVAGVLYRQKDFAESNFIYSQVFDKCPKLRFDAAYNFHPQEDADWNKSLAIANTNDMKAALWAIQGYYGDEIKAIEKIVELNPKSEHLEFLLTRLINNQEVEKNNYERNPKIIEKLKKSKDSLLDINVKLVSIIALSEKTAKPYLWNAAAGYLQTLNKNYDQADLFFEKAEGKMPKNTLAINQLRLLKVINYLSKIEKIDAKNESKIIPELVWLYDELPKKEIENFRYYNASAWSKKRMSEIYKSNNQIILSELFDRKPDFYETEENLLAMKSFLSNENKTVIENIGAKIYTVSYDDIAEYQSIIATFQNKIPEAIAFMKETKKQEIFEGNPFNGNIKDCNDCDFVAFQKRKYSSLDFLETIKIMQDKIASNEDVYTNAMLLGNGFYSITVFGNGHSFPSCNIMGDGFMIYDYDLKKRDIVADCSLAKSYYLQAFKAAKNDEQRAKCQYMLAKCERNGYYKTQAIQFENYWNAEYSKSNFLAWDGFKNLKDNYSNTKYYQEVIEQCGYFKTYIEQSKK